MATVYVSFTDSSKTAIDSVFGSAQDTAFWPYAGALEDTDPIYLAFVDPASTLAGARTAQAAIIDAEYLAAITLDVAFTTAAGVAQTYQADSDSQGLLLQAVQGYTLAGTVPTGFYWKAADNTLVTFTLSDLQGLYAAMLAQGWAAFQERTALKAEIADCAAVADVTGIVWPPSSGTATATDNAGLYSDYISASGT